MLVILTGVGAPSCNGSEVVGWFDFIHIVSN
jgi:hypothetical protein